MMSRRRVRGGAIAVALLAAATAWGQDLSPVGLWKTVGDDTGEPKAFVRIRSEGGKLVGNVEKLIVKPGEDPNRLCEQCPGEKHNQRIAGMTILWDLTQDGTSWTGGYILDPDNGKTYKCKLTVVDGGRRLDVRGFIGFSLLGRTQTWIRVE
jgi:uncharacterized protein (DUF2147 family)